MADVFEPTPMQVMILNAAAEADVYDANSVLDIRLCTGLAAEGLMERFAADGMGGYRITDAGRAWRAARG